MKTAMKDMISFLNKAIEMCHDKYEEKINFAWIKFHAELLLEKEKNQMIDAYTEGTECACDMHLDRFEEYYNKTYNQNK